VRRIGFIKLAVKVQHMRLVVRYVAVAATFIVALVAMLWGSTYSVPDLVRVDYGLPLRWGENTLDTIAGPVDRWSVDLMSLALDLAFWFAVLIAVQLIVFSYR
jgi:hypothetical protein